MLEEIWEPDLKILFVGAAVDETSDAVGFHYLHPKNRFWELVELGGITAQRIITPSERKALTVGHAEGSLSDPIRNVFIEKKTSQLKRLGIGLTYLNRRVIASGDKDKAARPTKEDIQHFLEKTAQLKPKILGFVVMPDLFVESFKSIYPDAAAALGLQPFTIDSAEVWLLGAPGLMLRGEALTRQEDAFFALGERTSSIWK